MNNDIKYISALNRLFILPILGAFCLIFYTASNICAQTAMVTNNFVYYTTETVTNYQCIVPAKIASNLPSSPNTGNRSFVDNSSEHPAPANGYSQKSSDPWVNSALIEYDNVYPSTFTASRYPNHCLTLCAEVSCSNPARRTEVSTGTSGNQTKITYVASGDFPIQTILFDIFKYQSGINPYSADSAPPIRTIAMYPGASDDVDNVCKGVGVPNPNATINSDDCCSKVSYHGCWYCSLITNEDVCKKSRNCSWSSGACGPSDGNNDSDGHCMAITSSSTCSADPGCIWYGSLGCRSRCIWQRKDICYARGCTYGITWEPNCVDTAANFSSRADCQAGISKLHFCTAWDGSYEIDGEFGKSNGQFGYRTTIKTNYPGDGISTASEVNIEHMIVYPGDSQIPIQVDVTNVHSVRSSPTLVGKSPAVISSPYRIRYRLSKDATTTINIMDTSENPYSNPGGAIVRHLVKGQPRDGEGFQGGAASDIQITNEDAWDGRDDEGRLLPYGNYLVSVQASSKDEWSGTTEEDLSRAVTRQLSLDPLKITDIVVSGLGKQSTNYAMINYMLTEAATVHFEVYTPGTVFEDLNICNSSTSTPCTNGYETNGNGLAGQPTIGKNTLGSDTGYRVASYVEQKAGRVQVNSKWDGMCWDLKNCTQTETSISTATGTTTGYAYGGAMPDGDYVYLLWAEIPYGSSAGSSAGGGNFSSAYSTISINGVKWDGVKTHMIYNGIMPINRGYPEITIDAVSYSTIGSSPSASGLDPFVFSYSLSRDSYIDMGIYTIAASGTATSGACVSGNCAPYLVKKIASNEVKEALTKNVYYWDGLNDEGRYVGAGNYMLRITAKDALFPAKMVTRTIEFPVDMFRVVDVATTPLLESSSGALKGLAGITYSLSKSMDVAVKIYDEGVLIPTGGTCPWPPEEPQTCTVWSTNKECCIHDTAYSTYTVPIKTFVGTRQGEGYLITDFWDGYEVDATQNEARMKKDGLYPYVIIASAPVGGTQYYESDGNGMLYPSSGTQINNGIYATDRPTGYITVSRGPVYFTNIKIHATKPTQYYSSSTIELAPYEIQFSVNRVSSVTIEVVSTTPGVCITSTSSSGTVCRTLTETTFTSGSLQENMVYDAEVLNTLYWDGKDSKGNYVKTANYQIRFTGLPYLNDGTVDSSLSKTVESRSLSVNNFQVFDRYIWDVSKQNKEQGKFAFQVSIPMKTAIQIYKPGTVVSDITTGDLQNPIIGSGVVLSTNTEDVLVKSIVGIRPNLVGLEEIWDGTDYAGQKVPDGIYPFRYVTVLNSYDMNSVTGDPILGGSSISDIILDWDKFVNMGIINVANGDSWYADIDWKSNQVTMFYPNPMVNSNDKGYFEITKVPAPGKVSIKIYNIAGDLVRDSNYPCVNAIGTRASLEEVNNTMGGLSPDWNQGTLPADPSLLGSNAKGRNFALRCEWDRTNNAGNKVARGLYYAIMTLDPTRGNANKSQKVIKILIP